MREKYIFICHPGCTTCKKARAWLDENGIVYEVRDIREENPSAEELRKVCRLSGRAPRKMFNTSGQLYRSMQLSTRLPAMTEEEQLKLLATDGLLVKRPLLISDTTVLTGFREAEWEQVIP